MYSFKNRKKQFISYPLADGGFDWNQIGNVVDNVTRPRVRVEVDFAPETKQIVIATGAMIGLGLIISALKK